MSHRWHIRCLDCSATHHFEDASHASDLMLAIIRERTAIARMHDLTRRGAELRYGYTTIDPAWFIAHEGHELAAYSEYRDVIRVAPLCCEAAPFLTRMGGDFVCDLPVGHGGEHRCTRDKRTAVWDTEIFRVEV